MSAEQIVNEKWGLAIPPIPQAYAQVTDVTANAFNALKGLPELLTRWSQMRTAFDNFLQVRLGRSLDSYYRIVKEAQLAAVLIMNPTAPQVVLFDICVGVQSCRPETVAEIQTQAIESAQLRKAVEDHTAFGEVPQGV